MGKGSVNDVGIYQSVRRGDIKDESNVMAYQLL